MSISGFWNAENLGASMVSKKARVLIGGKIMGQIRVKWVSTKSQKKREDVIADADWGQKTKVLPTLQGGDSGTANKRPHLPFILMKQSQPSWDFTVWIITLSHRRAPPLCYVSAELSSGHQDTSKVEVRRKECGMYIERGRNRGMINTLIKGTWGRLIQCVGLEPKEKDQSWPNGILHGTARKDETEREGRKLVLRLMYRKRWILIIRKSNEQ